MTKDRKSLIGTIIGCALILIWCLLPVVWIISLSFKSQDAITNGSPGFFPSEGGGAGWSELQRRPEGRPVPPARSSTRSASP